MPTSSGPHFLQNPSLVFAYDVGDKMSYKGITATNLITNITPNYGNQNGTYFKVNNFTSSQIVPTMGSTTVYSTTIYNAQANSGTCCVGLYNFGTNITVLPSTLYTYSLIYRSATNYTHPNFLYKYEYTSGGGSYVTEGGIFSTSNQQNLGNGWFWAWGQFTTQATTGQLRCYLYEYEDSQVNTYDIAGAMLVKGNYLIPPSQFIGLSSTNSVTTSLLDLTGYNSINLTNTSFDSNGQPYFAGSSNYISVANNSSLKNNNTSIEFIIKYNSSPTGDIIQFGVGSGTYAQYYYRLEGSSTTWNWFPTTGYGTAGRIVIPNSVFTTGKYYHIVMTGDQYGNVQFYINGVAQSGGSTSATTVAPTWTPNALTIGGYSWDGYSNTTIPVVRIYNKVISSIEINRNYQSYKNRFNLN